MALLYTGPIGAGGIGAGTTNATTQLLKNLSGKLCEFDFGDFLSDTVIGGVTGRMQWIKKAPFNMGQGNYNAIFKQMRTKFKNGAKNMKIKASTAWKMAKGRFWDTAAAPAAAVGAVANDVVDTIRGKYHEWFN